MNKVSREFSCSPAQVFDVLADGWLYASWVVGASRVRDVDPAWPMVGAQIHHSVGSWPVLLDDKTIVKEYDPARKLKLRARAWPAGEAEVTIHVTPSPDGCTVSIEEDATAGPARVIPAPLRQAMIGWRNTESLKRLEFLAVGRQKSPAETSSFEGSSRKENLP
jgi:uncharacterized protein YndB with AHSA1/START domain